MPGFISDSPLARGLIRIGDEAIAREDDAALRDYFGEDYVFHGPGGDLSFDQLRAYFASLRAAFSDLRIVREQIIADGKFLAARNTFSGDFTGVFTYSPIGPVEPTGQHLEWEVISTFRYDDDGPTGRGVGADGLPQLLDQARRDRHRTCRAHVRHSWLIARVGPRLRSETPSLAVGANRA